MGENVSRLPTPGVVLDLDTEERPAKDVKPPLVVRVGGKDITFIDPGELDWRDLASIQIPADLIQLSMSKDDSRHLQSLALPGWKFNRLMEAYYDHYDLEEKIRQAKRQQQGHQ